MEEQHPLCWAEEARTHQVCRHPVVLPSEEVLEFGSRCSHTISVAIPVAFGFRSWWKPAGTRYLASVSCGFASQWLNEDAPSELGQLFLLV